MSSTQSPGSAPAKGLLRENITNGDVALIAKALAHPSRIHIVRLLLEKQTCIGCDIVDEVGLAQSTVSEHLRILQKAGIIVGEIERPRVCYSLNPDRLLPLASLLNSIFQRDSRGELKGSVCFSPPHHAPAGQTGPDGTTRS